MRGPHRPMPYVLGTGEDAHPEVQRWSLLAKVTDLAPRVWIPAEAERAFYDDNALGSRLVDAFADLAGEDPDEDDVEERLEAVGPWIRSFAWDDESIDALYDALATVSHPRREGPSGEGTDPSPSTPRSPVVPGDAFVVRRLGSAAGRTARSPRGALLAVRDTWNDAWTLDAVVARMRARAAVDVIPAPVVVHAGDHLVQDAGRNRSWTHVLAAGEVDVWSDGHGHVTRVLTSRT